MLLPSRRLRTPPKEMAPRSGALTVVLTVKKLKVGSWTVVPSTDRHYRIYHIFKVIIDTLESALGAEKTRWPTIGELEIGAELEDSQALQSFAESSGDAKSLFWEYSVRGAQEEE